MAGLFVGTELPLPCGLFPFTTVQVRSALRRRRKFWLDRFHVYDGISLQFYD